MTGLERPTAARCQPFVLRRWVPAVWRSIAVAASLTGGCLVGEARGQNDWQYPDPYFGILEIEKSHDSGTWRRYRAEVSPAPRRDAATATDRPAVPADHPSTARTRFRWRTRSRR